MKVIVVAKAILACAVTASCATAPKIEENSSTQVDLKTSKEFKLKIESSKLDVGVVDYKFKGQTYKAQWLRCISNPSKPMVAIFFGNETSNAATFCNDWATQVFLQNGFNVATVNRPSFGQSTGKDDFSGSQSVAAITAGLAEAQKGNSIIGLWGFDAGSIAAAFVAKVTPNLQWLILGNGFYDMEIVERTTKSDTIQKKIQDQRTAEGESALESRSIAWDPSGLPKLIALYHSSLDEVAPKAQADAFNDQLRTAQSKVFFDDLQGVGHDIPWQAHFKIVTNGIKNLSHKN